MAVYGRHREKWDPTKVKVKVSKNRTSSLTTNSVTISGTSVTANPDNNTSSEGSQDTTNWYWLSSASGTTGNASGEDPKQPSSGVPIDVGGTYENEIYPMGNGSGATRLISYKSTRSGSQTVTFKIIACGGGAAPAVPARIFNPNGGSAGNAMGGTSTKEWTGGGSDPYRPIQLVYATDGFDHTANWQQIPGTIDIHGHTGSHPNVATANIDRTEFKSFSFDISVPDDSYIGIRQQTGGNQYNTWAIADLVITAPDRDIQAFDLKKTMWTHVSMGDTVQWVTARRDTASGQDDYHLTGYDRDQAYSTGDLSPTKTKIKNSKFSYAMDFDNALSGNSDQSKENYIREDVSAEYTPDQLFGDTGDYSQPGPRNIFFSFWIKTNSANANNDGHAFAHWGTGGSNGNHDEPHEIDPKIGFYINSSGGVSIRFCEYINSGDDINPTPDAGEIYVYADGQPAFIEVTSSNGCISPGNWHHVVVGLKFTSGWNETLAKNNTRIWVDGTERSVTRFQDSGAATFGVTSGNDDTYWEWQFGSLVNGLGSLKVGTTISSMSTSTNLVNSNAIVKVADATGVDVGAELTKISGAGAFNSNSVTVSSVDTSTTPHEITVAGGNNGSAGAITFSVDNPDSIRRSSGFSGALGEFTVITQDLADEAARNTYAKFLYEANREGVFGLHSGIHSSSPRLEQLDLDRDTAYPNNFTMPIWTKFERRDYFGYDEDNADTDNEESTGIDTNTIPDPRASLTSTERFTEGYNTSDTNYEWKEKASQYFVQTTSSGTTQTHAMLPHLKLHPSDTLLTNGNWYSDDRSEFFPEDLHVTTGFVINKANDAAGHTPITSTDLYKEHVTNQKVLPFIDDYIPEEYKDCFVIEIPLPHVGNSLKLSTDVEDLTTTNEKELATLKFNSGGSGSGTVVDPTQKINTMAYYNFKDSKWEHTTPSYTTFSVDGKAGGLPWLGTGDVGFSPMSGLVIHKDMELLPYFTSLYGKPISDFGFPFHKKFESADGQTIDLSKYIDEPVILAGWEIYCNVIPRTGYSHNIGNGVAVNDEEGYKQVYGNSSGTFNNSTSKTPLYYGGTGEACVFWDPDTEPIPFHQKSIGSAPSEHRYDNTVPVSNFNSEGKESLGTKTSVGLVTKGVTAFLLKETDLFDKKAQRQKFLRTHPRYISGNANNIAGNSYDWDRSAVDQFFTNVIEKGDSIIDSTAPGSVDGTKYPMLSYDFYEPKFPSSNPAGRYSRGSSRELIGYLQHVYHNDENGTLNRQYWQREEGSINYGHKALLGGGPTSIINSLNKENNTYVPDLLRKNTSKYPIHVKGSTKIQTPIAGSFPISNFLIAGSANGALGTYKHHGTASNIDLYQSYAVIPSSEGSTYSDMIQHDAIPNMFGKTRARQIALPKAVYPAGAPQGGTHSPTWSEAALTSFPVSLAPENEDCDVVLRPGDKLVLGIQDSVSTCFASQQIQGQATSKEFVRWGRNYLEFPADKDGYLRLFVKRTRQDKTFNIVSDESRYNANVNRDLGDHFVDDDHFVNSPLMYSGSMADDIMGPTYLTPPMMDIDVVVDSNIANTDVTGNFSSAGDAGSHNWGNAINVIGQLGDNGTWPGIQSGKVPAAVEEFKIPWNIMSHNAFKDRNESDTPRWPAIDWKDANNSSGSEDQWYNCSMIFHWPLADKGTNSSGANQAWDKKSTPGGGTDFRFRNYSVPAELNTNSGAPATNHVQLAGGADVTLMGYDNPAMSAWNVKIMLPIFETASTLMTPNVSAISVEVRVVRILAANYSGVNATGGSPADGYAGIPSYSDGTDMALGDAFYFDDNNACVKLNLDLDPAGSITANQKFLRNWIGKRDEGPLVFIVAGKISNSSGSPGSLVGSSLKYRDVYSIISRLLYIHSTWDTSVLCTVSNHWGEGVTTLTGSEVNGGIPQGHDGNFKISIPQDTSIVSFFKNNQTDINNLMAFKLCGVTIEQDSPVGDVADSVIEDNIRFWKSGAPNAISGLDFNNTLSGGMLSNNGTTHNIDRTNFIEDYFLPMTDGTLDNGTLVSGGGTKLSHTMYKIDFANITRSVPQLVITDATYSKAKGINRQVQRRSSEAYNKTDTSYPLTAGPFGSLKNYQSFTGTNLIWDSIPSRELTEDKTGYCSTHTHKTEAACTAAHAGNWVRSNWMSLLTDVPQQFPFENTTRRGGLKPPKGIKVKMKTLSPGGVSNDNTPTVLYSSATGDSTVGDYSWGHSTSSSNHFTEGSLGYLNVTNYIQKDFKGNGDFSRKTVEDLLIGFGDGVQGKHILRPSLHSYDGWTGSDPNKFATEFIIDPPRGARFGQFNIARTMGTYKFSYHHFGFFRDMVQQSLDTKFVLPTGGDPTIYGSPVKVVTFSSTNPNSPKPIGNTSRYNKNLDCTIVKPWIEHAIDIGFDEAPPSSVGNTSANEQLRVNFPGAMRTSNVVPSPGSISDMIRRRSTE